ncbi:MAG: amino acid adenylation domain-containing protein, partial [bacterium]|nr:amino acid adenylation domain-containing protein [bacterium]
SSAQKRLYFLQQLNPESIAYNVYDAIIVEGEPEPERLRTTFERLIRRHESLRTSFQVIDGKPVQKISLAEDIDFQMEITTIQNHGDEQQVVERVRDFIRPFDLKHAPLFRVGLLKIAPTQHLLLVDMHHIISDGISHSILVEDFSSLYSGQQLDELPLQYKDYSEWQQNPEIKLSLSNQEKYWLRKFDGEIPVLYLPTDFPRPELQSFEGDIATFELSEKESSALNKFARLMGATPFMTLLSVFYIVLFKISSQEDIVIGTPIAGRDHTDLERIIGMFVNTLALRSFPTGEQTFQTFLTMVKDETLAAFENRNYLFEDLVEKAAVQRDMSRNPLFDVMFVYRNILTSKQTTSEQQLENFQIKSYDFEHRTSKFDLTLNATESEDKFVLHFEYCTKLFKEETIEKFIQYFKKIVVSIVNSRQKKLMEIEIITGEEKKIVLYGLNQTEAEYPKDKTIYQLFEEQSNKTPDSLALAGNLSVPQSQASGYSQVTFRELHRQVVSLALELRHHGVRPGTVTGLLAERSLEMVVGMLAILAAGSAYLPLDPEYPSQRLRFMLKDSAAQRLLVTPGMPDVEGFEETTIVIPEPAAALSETTGESLNDFDSQNLAYVIYTSGTTGRPKGVPITHRAVANLICWQIEACEMDHLDRVLLLSSICFDFSVMQIHSALLSGAALLVIDKGPLLNAAVFEKYLLRQLLTHLCVVPAFLENLRLMRFPGLRRIMVGGDVCPPQLASMWLDKCAIYNCYGPTENTVMSLQARISEDDCDKPMLTIGTPIGNTTVYILDKQMLPVPNGIPGELYIGGAGVAPGYLNRPELTAEKFIPNPYARSTSENRIYKTGDLVRVLDDGTVHFLGRLDNQVKIRGFRIELGEIEAQLLTVKTVKGAVVLAEKNDKGDTHLCAYFVSDSPQAPSASDLRAYLKKRLPPYMVPSFITPLEKMPLTINGKIDRKALAALKKIPLAAGPRIAPRNRTEEKLLELWTDILGLEEELISMDSN